MNKTKQLSPLAKEWSFWHRALKGADVGIIIIGIVFAVLVDFASQGQRIAIDVNLQEIYNNQTVLAPLLGMFTLSTLGYLYCIFNQKHVPGYLLTSMAKTGEHGIMNPLLFFVVFFISDNLMKSCSAEVIVTTWLLIIVLNAIFILFYLIISMRKIADNR